MTHQSGRCFKAGFLDLRFDRGGGHGTSYVREVVIVRVQSAQPIDSPAYDLGLTEDEVRDRSERYFHSLRAGKTTSPGGE